jgi:hypothetical protein
MKRLGLLLLLCGFHQPATFEASINDGGGNRVYFDGSPRQRGYDCSACHTLGEGTITATAAFPSSYQPSMQYTVTVALAGEHAGFGTANNQNGFVAEVVDDGGAPAGAFAAQADATTTVIDDGNVIAGEGKDVAMWSFAWTAPAAGRGPITLHLGMVDGDGAASASVPQNDPGGDDATAVHLRACEAGAACGPVAAPPQTDARVGGCQAGGTSAPWLVVLALAVVCLLRRRRRLVVAAFVLAGCYDPLAPSDCPDHVCGAETTDAGSSCKESWTCTAWETSPGTDQATRSCTDTNMVGTSECKPATTATLPALDMEAFKCRVAPIFQRGCGQLACHGTDTGHAFRLYTRGRLRNNEMVFPVNTCNENQAVKVNLQMRGTATVMCEGWSKHTATEWQKNFDSARSFMLDVTSPDDSLILREAAKGGLPHAQVKLFAPGDADYVTIRNWLGGASLGTTCNTGSN